MTSDETGSAALTGHLKDTHIQLTVAMIFLLNGGALFVYAAENWEGMLAGIGMGAGALIVFGGLEAASKLGRRL